MTKLGFKREVMYHL